MLCTKGLYEKIWYNMTLIHSFMIDAGAMTPFRKDFRKAFRKVFTMARLHWKRAIVAWLDRCMLCSLRKALLKAL